MRLPTPFEMAVPNPDLEMRQLSYRPFPRRLHPFRLSPQSLFRPSGRNPCKLPACIFPRRKPTSAGRAFEAQSPFFPRLQRRRKRTAAACPPYSERNGRKLRPHLRRGLAPDFSIFFRPPTPTFTATEAGRTKLSPRRFRAEERTLAVSPSVEIQTFSAARTKETSFLPLTTARERRRNARSAARGIFLTTRTIRKILTVCVPIFRNSAAECLRKAIRPERATYLSVVLRAWIHPA